MPDLMESVAGLLTRINEVHSYGVRENGGIDLCLECRQPWPCGTYTLTKIKLEEIDAREPQA